MDAEEQETISFAGVDIALRLFVANVIVLKNQPIKVRCASGGKDFSSHLPRSEVRVAVGLTLPPGLGLSQGRTDHSS